MKPEITFKHVYTNETGRVRVYKASKPLQNKADGKQYREEPKIFKLYSNKERTETKDVEFSNIFDYVVVSDAHTHTERLAFPAWEYEPLLPDGIPYMWENDTIAGYHTFMTHGGDSEAVYPDKVYLRMLAKANGYQYKKEEN